MFGVDEALLGETPYVWIGSAGEIADQLRAGRERWGFSYLVVQSLETMRAIAPVVAELAGT